MSYGYLQLNTFIISTLVCCAVSSPPPSDVSKLNKARLNEKSFETVKNLHVNWYIHAVKALMGQLGKELYQRLDDGQRKVLLKCLDGINDERDLVYGAKCLSDARKLSRTNHMKFPDSGAAFVQDRTDEILIVPKLPATVIEKKKMKKQPGSVKNHHQTLYSWNRLKKLIVSSLFSKAMKEVQAYDIEKKAALSGQTSAMEQVAPQHNESFKRQEAENESFRRQEAENESFRRQKAENESFRRQEAENESFRRQKAENESFRRQKAENESFRRQEAENESFRRQEAETEILKRKIGFKTNQIEKELYRSQVTENVKKVLTGSRPNLDFEKKFLEAKRLKFRLKRSAENLEQFEGGKTVANGGRRKLYDFEKKLFERNKVNFREKRSPYRLIADQVSKSDSEVAQVMSMKRLKSLIDPGSTKTPVQKVTKLIRKLFINGSETKDDWLVTYRKLLEFKKNMEAKKKQPGAKVYDFRLFDIVAGSPNPTKPSEQNVEVYAKRLRLQTTDRQNRLFKGSAEKPKQR